MLSPTPILDVFAALMLVTATVSGTRLAAARLPAAGRWPAGSPGSSRPGRAHGRAVRPGPTTTSPTC